MKLNTLIKEGEVFKMTTEEIHLKSIGLPNAISDYEIAFIKFHY